MVCILGTCISVRAEFSVAVDETFSVDRHSRHDSATYVSYYEQTQMLHALEKTLNTICFRNREWREFGLRERYV